jgi:hypothetical protein
VKDGFGNCEPEFVQLVAREPTTAMLRVDVEYGPTGEPLSGCHLGAVWRAMWDAALTQGVVGDPLRNRQAESAGSDNP